MVRAPMAQVAEKRPSAPLRTWIDHIIFPAARDLSSGVEGMVVGRSMPLAITKRGRRGGLIAVAGDVTGGSDFCDACPQAVKMRIALVRRRFLTDMPLLSDKSR